MVSDPLLYVDMDGVVCDFYTSAQSFFDFPIDNIDSEILFSKCCGLSFWEQLPIFKWTYGLIEILELYTKNWIFLTKSTSYDPYCMSGKMLWIKKHFPNKQRDVICVNTKKSILGNQGRFLIDDLNSNCNEWHQRGGQFFLWKPKKQSSDQEINQSLSALISNLDRFFNKL